MTTNDTWNRLTHIDSEIQKLFRDAGYDYDDGFSLVSCPDNGEHRFLMDSLVLASRSLLDFHEQMDYLRTPAKEPCILHLTEDDRYGFCDKDGHIFKVHCGQVLEALIADENGSSRWRKTRMEHNGVHYYLTGCGPVSLDGLTVRVRRASR